MNSLLDAVDMLNGGVIGNHDDHHQQNGYDFDNSADYEPEGDDDDVDGDVFLQSNGKRARKEEIQWTEQKEYALVCIYKAQKAYMRGKKGELKLEQKRLVAFNKVKDHASFKDDAQSLTAGGVHAKFTRLWKAVSQKYALSGEGANLSGLPENPPRVDAALYNMIKEKIMSTVQVAKGKQKDLDRNIRLNKHRDSMLAGMVRDHAINPSLMPAPPAQQVSSSSTSTTAAVVDRDVGVSNTTPTSAAVSSLSSTSTTKAADSMEQKWLDFMERREARRAGSNEPSLQGTLVELEAKRVQLEEQRLRVDEQRIQVEKMNAENNRRMFELFAQQMNSAFSQRMTN
jgi:hypothetical protein